MKFITKPVKGIAFLEHIGSNSLTGMITRYVLTHNRLNKDDEQHVTILPAELTVYRTPVGYASQNTILEDIMEVKMHFDVDVVVQCLSSQSGFPTGPYGHIYILD